MWIKKKTIDYIRNLLVDLFDSIDQANSKFLKVAEKLDRLEINPTVKIVNKSNNALPSYATEFSAGMDLRAHLSYPITLKPMERQLVPTGLFMELPAGYEAEIRSRSGVALKNFVTVLNSPGTIDADYRGEIKILLINWGTEDFVINNGDRIAQMVIDGHATAKIVESEVLSETDRSSGGFGHTGVK